ncbi:diaminopimelate epimerase [Bombilactobacillus folatiphilus]|uniref:Diaminopimelate epimerase n=2 Tax=Bombilactobacillus folatiphilus TaxID=2923362 RepID=A0ABY4P9T9_9LACO|nr:diaminopimelate epimerase [Bombilactobacillus folatiphilus]UQS82518.1 diaminopimelate epimerase [Bombilactobacillus folatiphilus]
MQLLKVHGSLNQFFLLDQTQLQQPLTSTQLAQLVQNLAQAPNFGLVDGLLVIDQPSDPEAIAQMRVFNADGSQASMCGNGLRTVARYLADQNHLDQFQVQTPQQTLQVKRYPDLAPQVPAFGVEISPVSFALPKIGLTNVNATELINQPLPELDPQLTFTAIAVPNPHLISFVDDLSDQENRLVALGQRLNAPNPYFPDGVNLSFAQILADQQLFVQTFERGVGLTNACGTGMSATSLAFVLTYPQQAQLDKSITVYNPGGLVQVKVHQVQNRYWMELIGNATIMGHLTLSEATLHDSNADFTQIKLTLSPEVATYEQRATKYRN